MEMVEGASPMPLLVQLRIMGEAILHGALDNLFRLDEAVGLRHDVTVDAPRLMIRRSPMILNRLSHRLDFLLREPLP